MILFHPQLFKQVSDLANISIKSENVSQSFSSINSNTTLNNRHQGIILISGNTTITLPDTALFIGKAFTLKKIDETGHTVTISGIVDGESNPQILYQYDYITIVSDGSNWYKVAEHLTTQ